MSRAEIMWKVSKKEKRRAMKNTDRVVGQATSGRWLLTIIAGACLLLLTILDCRAYMKYPEKPLPVSVEAIFAVITMVFMSYFHSSKDGNGQQVEPETDMEQLRLEQLRLESEREKLLAERKAREKAALETENQAPVGPQGGVQP